MFKKIFSFLLIYSFVFTFCILGSVNSTLALDKPVQLTFGAMPIGTSWYVFGASISKLLGKVLPPGSKVELLAGGGGVANALIVAQGKADIAISNACAIKWAHDGTLVYKGKEAKNLRVITGGFAMVWIAQIYNEAFIKKTGIDSLEKLIEKKYPIRIATKPKGSIALPIIDLVFEKYGISFDKINEWGGSHIQVETGQIPEMMRDGRVDLWIESFSEGHPSVTEGALTADLRIVGFPDWVINDLNKYGLYGGAVPANSYRLQTKPVKTVGLPTVVFATEKLPEEIAYITAKVICENKNELVASSAAWKDWVPESSWKPENTGGAPLHPGAVRYYRERGWMK